jgi:hypothetical protein
MLSACPMNSSDIVEVGQMLEQTLSPEHRRAAEHQLLQRENSAGFAPLLLQLVLFLLIFSSHTTTTMFGIYLILQKLPLCLIF